MRKIVWALMAAGAMDPFGQKFEGLAPAPPMGWNEIRSVAG